MHLSYEITTPGVPKGIKKKKKVFYGNAQPCHKTLIPRFIHFFTSRAAKGVVDQKY